MIESVRRGGEGFGPFGGRRRVDPPPSAASTGDGASPLALPPPRTSADGERVAGGEGAAHAYFGGVASSAFLTQLMAVYLGDGETGDRRVRRDPSLVRARADETYRAAARRGSAIEAGFLEAVSY